MTGAGISVGEVMTAASRRLIGLAPETVGYLVLGIADQVEDAPRRVDPSGCVLLIDGGRILLHPSMPACAADQAEIAVRQLLGQLLRATTGRAPALFQVGSRAPAGTVRAVITEIESALVPVNREAARRALARLARDVLRVREQGPWPSPRQTTRNAFRRSLPRPRRRIPCMTKATRRSSRARRRRRRPLWQFASRRRRRPLWQFASRRRRRPLWQFASRRRRRPLWQFASRRRRRPLWQFASRRRRRPLWQFASRRRRRPWRR